MPLAAALGRVLAEDVIAEVDVPGFDRSNVDGFAVRAADLDGASAERPARAAAQPGDPGRGRRAAAPGRPGTATVIATGGMVPRGADAVVMVEHTELADEGDAIEVLRAAAPGQFVAFAGTDIARGETVLRRGQLLTSREIGVLAAVGRAQVPVVRRPRVAILSTGDEIVPPGAAARPGQVYDSTRPCWPPPSRSWAASRSRSASARRRAASCAGGSRRRWTATSSCSPAGPRRGRATSPTGSCASCATRASSPTAWR